MSATFPSDVQRIASEVLTSARMNGIAVGLARGDQPFLQFDLGTDATGRPLTDGSLFPVASVTKLATALAVLRLVDRGIMALDDPLALHLPEAAAAQPGVTLRRLLCHIAGLPMDVAHGAAPYELGLDWQSLAAACLQTPLAQPPATRVQYSNVGYGLLAIIVATHSGWPFPKALQELVLEPLGIEGYLGEEPPRPPVMLADTRGPEGRPELEPFNSPFWRSLAMPWAGLLTTVEGALKLVQAFLGIPSGFLRPETRAEAIRNQVGELGGGYVKPMLWDRCPWGLGPELRGRKSPHWAPLEAGEGSFGHAGASGILAWADPTSGVAWVIAGTRTAARGWLLRRGPALGVAILAAARGV